MKQVLVTIVTFALTAFLTGCGVFSVKTDTEEMTSSVHIETTMVTEPTIHDEKERSEHEEEKSKDINHFTGTYLGLSDYGYINIENVDEFCYRFDVKGEEKVYKIADSKTNGYKLQNILKEGYIYEVSVNEGFITSAKEIDKEFENDSLIPVSGNPGERTLKNFLATALMPVGSTLYVYGGGWNWQDEGASVQAQTIGISKYWYDFFKSKDEGYTYKDKDGKEYNADPASSYYPYGNFIEYYYAGLDCSGYLGWTLYNTFETEDGKGGYVYPSTENSMRLADRGWGDLIQKAPFMGRRNDKSVHPGDIISIKGHVWISLGTCRDGSVLLSHSSPSFSRSGQPGGGVQIAALGENKDCAAFKIANKFMNEYYPEWSRRYETTLVSPDVYFDFQDDRAGIFSWYTDGRNGGLTDPEDIKHMDPKDVLDLLFSDR